MNVVYTRRGSNHAEISDENESLDRALSQIAGMRFLLAADIAYQLLSNTLAQRAGCEQTKPIPILNTRYCYTALTRTRTNTNPNDTEANAAGRNVRACVACKSKS